MKLQRSIVSEMFRDPEVQDILGHYLKNKGKIIIFRTPVTIYSESSGRPLHVVETAYCTPGNTALTHFPSGIDAHSFESGSDKKQLYIKPRPQCNLVMWAA